MSFLFGLVEILVTYVFVGFCMMVGIVVIGSCLNNDFLKELKEDELIRR